MGTVAAGLSSVGGSLAQAQELRRQDALKKQQSDLRQSRFGLEKDRFDFEKKQANRPSYKGFATVGNKIRALIQDPDGKMRVQSFDNTPHDSFSAATLKAIESIKDPALKQAAQNEAGIYLEAGDTKGALQAVRSRMDKAQADTEAETRRTQQETFSKEQQARQFKEEEKLVGMRKGMEGASGIPEKTLKALADKWHNEGVAPPTKYRAPVEEYMEDNKINTKVKLSPKEQALKDVIQQIEPKVSQLEKIIEDNKLQGKGGLGAAIGSHYQFSKYKAGLKPDQVNADVIKAAAALQVMGAAPWMQLGRGKYMFETISKHLPNPTDSPALLYDKAKFLKGIVDEAKDSLPDSSSNSGQQNIDSVLDEVFGARR